MADKQQVWEEFLRAVDRTEEDVKGWDDRDLDEELIAQRFTGRRAGDVRSYWRSLKGNTKTGDIGLIGARQRFIELLRQSGIQPNPSTVSRISMAYTQAMIVNSDSKENALAFYQMVEKIPGSSTKVVIRRDTGLSVNGPWNLQLYGDMILSAVERNGRPVLLKLLSSGNDKSAVSILQHFQFNVEVPLVPSELIEVDFTQGIPNKIRTKFECLSMPHFPTSAELMPQHSDDALYKGGQRIYIALKDYVHSKNLVHMDIKPSNIFVDMQGNWFLGDFGSCVYVNANITSCTKSYIFQGYEDTVAVVEHDWFMLLATLSKLMSKDSDMLANGYANIEIIESRINQATGDLGTLLRKLATLCNLDVIKARVHRT